jgi:NADPH:quinone reductase-like Zn-dependent oxidoreductase
VAHPTRFERVTFAFGGQRSATPPRWQAAAALQQLVAKLYIFICAFTLNGVGENGTWQEWLLVRPEHLALVPDAIDDVVAASVPVAYLTAQVTLTLAGFKPGMTVLTPGIGGSAGNATFQLARAQGAGRVISTAGSAAKAAKARELGFEEVVDLSAEGLAEGVRRITAGKGVDIVIESIGGAVTSGALSSLCLGGVLITLGYSAGRKTTIDVTDLIWKARGWPVSLCSPNRRRRSPQRGGTSCH